MGKFLIIVGLIILLLGIGIQYSDKIPFLGKLPGDIRIERENFRFYLPLTSSILISLLVSLIIYIMNKGKS